MTRPTDLAHTWPARVQEVLWLTTAATVPLAFNPWGYNAFELPKTSLLKALALLMGLAALIQVIERHGDRERSRKLHAQQPRIPPTLLWPAMAFGLGLILATVFSVNRHVSLWGSYDRQQGLLTLGAYIALFLLTAANLRTRAQIERLWTAIVWGSAPVIVYGIVQAIGRDPLGWQTDAASPVLSTIGRANFLGSYLVLVIPLTLARSLPLRRRWPCLLLLTGQLVCLALTQARGAWMGLGGAIVVGLLAWALATGDRRPALAALAVLGLAGGFVMLLNLPDGPLTPLSQLPGLDRLASLTRTDAGSTAARLTIWRATLPLIAARPILGYGPETMRPVFARVFPPQLVYYQGRHVTVDRAHNLWLDLGMSGGMVAIATFTALLVGIGRMVWQRLRTAGKHAACPSVLWIALAAAIVGHIVDLQFSFDLTASATIFWLALAMATALRNQLNHKERKNDPDEPVKNTNSFGSQGLTYLPPTLAALALIGLVCLRPLLANSAHWQAGQNTRASEERLAAAERAVRLWPLEPEYRASLAWTYLQDENLAAAEVQLDAADRLSPHDPRVWAARGALYAYCGEIEPGRLIQAEAAYRQALKLAPNIASTHTSLGLVLAQQGRLEEGLLELERAVALDATDGMAYRHLADLYQMLGREREADRARKEAERWRDE